MIEVDKKHTALFNCFKQLSKNAFNSSKEDQGEGGGGGGGGGGAEGRVKEGGCRIFTRKNCLCKNLKQIRHSNKHFSK